MDKIKIVFGTVIAVIAITIMLAWPVQILWNSCVVSVIDGTHLISFWQALGLNLLFSILFKHSITNTKTTK